MRRLVSEAYSWEPIRVDQSTFEVEFPRSEDLQRLLTFGVSKVSGSKCLLEFEECIKPALQGTRLQKVSIRFSGIPEILLNDFLIIWSLGSLIGKTEKVDMPFTRKRGIAGLLVMVLDVEQIPDFAPWSYDGVHYDLDVEVEKVSQKEPNGADIHMADGEDRDKDHGDANDRQSDQSKENINPPPASSKEKPLLIGGASSTSNSPMAALRFGSFDVMSASYNLGSAFVQKEELNHTSDVEDGVDVNSKETFSAEEDYMPSSPEDYTPLSPEDLKIEDDGDLDSSSSIK
ncbi:hypothetical protein D1007_05676 [Hordeum vulgare]|nr:hypothetical protein D1007_05676 [Hordeum vulgare]